MGEQSRAEVDARRQDRGDVGNAWSGGWSAEFSLGPGLRYAGSCVRGRFGEPPVPEDLAVIGTLTDFIHNHLAFHHFGTWALILGVATTVWILVRGLFDDGPIRRMLSTA